MPDLTSSRDKRTTNRVSVKPKPAKFTAVTSSIRIRPHAQDSTIDRLCDFVARFSGPDRPTVRDFCAHQGCETSSGLTATKAAVRKGLLHEPKEGPRGWVLKLTRTGSMRARKVADKCRGERHALVSSL